jgi:hypothetical protein
MVVHADEKQHHGEFTTEELIRDIKDNIHPKPYCEGKHLGIWLPREIKWLEWGTKRAPHHFRRLSFPELLEREKILVQRSPGPDPKCCFDEIGIHFTDSSVGFIPWHSLSGVRNNSLKKSARYADETPSRPDLPQREGLEATSRRFAVKYLLGVMNSSAARDFLRANRRSNIHLYPDDWKNLPIPAITLARQQPIVALVDRILAAKAATPAADISPLETEIDRLVSALYGTHAPETAIVEDK